MSDTITYQEAGVDTHKAQRFIRTIKKLAGSTHSSACLNTIGSFGALFEIPPGYHQPVLVSGTDGVGTKLKIAQALNQHDTLGIDLVAMCANDILAHGAKPLFFLDYYATGQLQLEQSQAIIRGIVKGCELAEMSLVGGETAEMPDCYAGSDYD